jgi:hypothetical protein
VKCTAESPGESPYSPIHTKHEKRKGILMISPKMWKKTRKTTQNLFFLDGLSRERQNEWCHESNRNRSVGISGTDGRGSGWTGSRCRCQWAVATNGRGNGRIITTGRPVVRISPSSNHIKRLTDRGDCRRSGWWRASRPTIITIIAVITVPGAIRLSLNHISGLMVSHCHIWGCNSRSVG